MSATTDLPVLDVSGTPRVPFGRLLSVELRKMADTRAGFWLLVSTGLLLLAVAIIALIVIVANEFNPDFEIWVTQIMVIPLSLLLPVFAITSVTSEWSQRSGLVTFALEPNRSRVLAAKLVCVLALALTAMALAVGLSAVALLIQGALGKGPDWSMEGSALFWIFVQQILYFMMAYGLGVLLLSSAAAVTLYYVFALLVPLLVWGPIYGLVSWGPDTIPWFDMGYAIAPFTTPGVPKPDLIYAQIATSAALWVLVPVSIGLRRALRNEVK